MFFFCKIKILNKLFRKEIKRHFRTVIRCFCVDTLFCTIPGNILVRVPLVYHISYLNRYRQNPIIVQYTAWAENRRNGSRLGKRSEGGSDICSARTKYAILFSNILLLNLKFFWKFCFFKIVFSFAVGLFPYKKRSLCQFLHLVRK